MTSLRRTLPPRDQLSLFASSELDKGREVVFEELVVETSELARRDKHDVFNGRLLDGLKVVGYYGIPQIQACALVPHKLISFSEAMAAREVDPEAWVHFYEDDDRFVRFWNRPETYLEKLRRFGGVVSPDHSLYRNMVRAQQIDSTFKNRLLGAWMQRCGLDVIANVRLSGHESVPYALAGIPRHATLSLGLHGCTRDRANRAHVIEEIGLICDHCGPSALLVYGSSAYGVLDEPRRRGISVHLFPPDTRRRSEVREAA